MKAKNTKAQWNYVIFYKKQNKTKKKPKKLTEQCIQIQLHLHHGWQIYLKTSHRLHINIIKLQSKAKQNQQINESISLSTYMTYNA